MKENVIQIQNCITINFDVSVKNIIYMKKIMFGILLHVLVKIENIDNLAITCDKVIKETKTVPANFNKKSSL